MSGKKAYKPRCIHVANPAGGFVASHGWFCTSCDADATAHVAVGSQYCGNFCAGCAKRYASRKDAVITSGAIIAVDEDNE